jgi:hypothetical protein
LPSGPARSHALRLCLMRIKKLIGVLAVFFFADLTILSVVAHADYDQRLSIGAGFVTMSNPSQTSFELGAEFEHRLDPLLGLGVSANYIFSSPGVTLVAVPDVFFHPLAGEFFLSAAPLLEFGWGTGTNVGARVGTSTAARITFSVSGSSSETFGTWP